MGVGSKKEMKWHGIQNWETIGGMKEINLNILYDGTRVTGDCIWIRDIYYNTTIYTENWRGSDLQLY